MVYYQTQTTVAPVQSQSWLPRAGKDLPVSKGFLTLGIEAKGPILVARSTLEPTVNDPIANSMDGMDADHLGRQGDSMDANFETGDEMRYM